MRLPENSSDLTDGAGRDALGSRSADAGEPAEAAHAHLHFPPDDHLRRDVQAAYDAMHGLRVMARYLACNAQKREKSPTGNYEQYRRKRK